MASGSLNECTKGSAQSRTCHRLELTTCLLDLMLDFKVFQWENEKGKNIQNKETPSRCRYCEGPFPRRGHKPDTCLTVAGGAEGRGPAVRHSFRELSDVPRVSRGRSRWAFVATYKNLDNFKLFCLTILLIPQLLGGPVHV